MEIEGPDDIDLETVDDIQSIQEHGPSVAEDVEKPTDEVHFDAAQRSIDSLLAAAREFPEIAKDVEFLSKFYTFFNEHANNTSKLFTSHITQFRLAYQSAKKSAKNRVEIAQK